MSNKKNGAVLVGMGIFLSRIAGLIRERAFAHYFGNSDAGDAFKAALKIPNFLQNLFGEGVLSASFIPVYAGLLAREHNEHQENPEYHLEAAEVASAVGSLMFLLTSALVIIGVVLTPFLIDTVAPGFHGEKRLLTIKLVQIFFPGTGFLVMSAWCLGILNSHRRFFLSYVAPVVWNFAIIVALVLYGKNNTQTNLAVITAWGLVIGSFLQFAIQVPTTLKLLKHFKPNLQTKSLHVQIVLKNFFPSLISRGVVQLSAYIDNILASLLASGAVSTLAYAQALYTLPISLFGMSISASELPEMSSYIGSPEEVHTKLRNRLQQALEKVAFFIVPSVAAFVFLGDVMVAALYQTGEFGIDQTFIVWLVLIGSSVGLLASTMGRLYSSTFFSLKDTKTTLNFAIVRVILTTVLGYLFSFVIIPIFWPNNLYATVGLTASAGMAGWIEFALLRHKLNNKIGKTGITIIYQAKLWFSAFIGALLGLGLKVYVHYPHPIIRAFVVFAVYGVAYFIITSFLKVDISKSIIAKVTKKIRR